MRESKLYEEKTSLGISRHILILQRRSRRKASHSGALPAFFLAKPPHPLSFTAEKPADQAKDLAEILLQKRILVRCERMYKKPPPGQARLTRFPRKLVLPEPQERATFARESFYAWGYQRPMSPWAYFYAGLIVLGVLFACLFPLAPLKLRLAVVYISAGLLSVILSVLAVRSVMATVSWIGTGRTVWLLPNLLADDVPFKSLFTPVISVQERSEGPIWKGLAARAGVLVALASIVWGLYSRGPDQASVKRGASKLHDEMLEWLNLHREHSKKIGSSEAGTTATEPLVDGDAAAPDPSPPLDNGETTEYFNEEL